MVRPAQLRKPVATIFSFLPSGSNDNTSARRSSVSQVAPTGCVFFHSSNGASSGIGKPPRSPVASPDQHAPPIKRGVQDPNRTRFVAIALGGQPHGANADQRYRPSMAESNYRA